MNQTQSDSFYRSISLGSLKGIGAVLCKKFAQQGVNNLFDLLFYLPFRYLDKTYLCPLNKLVPEKVLLARATIVSSHVFVGRMRVLRLELEDESGKAAAVFFNPYPSQERHLLVGQSVTLYGLVRQDNRRLLCFQHPEYSLQEQALEKTLLPVYHSFGGTKQGVLRKAVKQALDRLSHDPLQQLLPSKYNRQGFDINEALLQIHYPLPTPDHSTVLVEQLTAFEGLCFEELVAYQLSLLRLKQANLQRTSPKLSFNPTLYEKFTHSLSFKLTGAQQRCFAQICADLQQPTPMLRLLHGDVGSGKTLVALLACLQVASNGYQSVLLVPTELLAQQHYQSFSRYLQGFKIRLVLLHSSQPKAQRQENLAAIQKGTAQIIIGTHSVFQTEVVYHNLALAIIDEQHRFGIGQRVALLHKAPAGSTLHQLIMTATPIPRTQQLALFADLDVSTLDELPQGRQPITTSIIEDRRRLEVMTRLLKPCSQGTQVYWICPRIEKAEQEGEHSVLQSFEQLQQTLPQLRIGLLHGQLDSKSKDEVMSAFAQQQLDILVATTIVEVGVDVPNANIIIIEDAQSLGLAQLHQLRGRVGRGSQPAFCILLHDLEHCANRLIANARLNIMRQTTDGFKIAQEDLKLRGPGEVIGERQSGFSTFRLCDVIRDQKLLLPARQVAQEILNEDSALSTELIKRWFPNYLSM